MNEEERVGKEVARLLNHSIGEINQDTLYRLQAARRAAMKNYQLEEKIIHVGAGMAGQNGLDSFFSHTGKLVLPVMVLFVLMATLYWKISYEVDEKAAIDTMILADDLPVDVYLDDEFDIWLESTR
ncbi:conserved hypothetical protein [Nitrosomonas nitrosa]|jgi:hypothetical protein|uniref:DUF3619 domain-containing protein n=1 Tax=Nitrosomonas nitrosa TaxID=52442 RepID=A0A1I4QLQ3_9PROT|nr:DUF3619 family protein [Nitrosomonas nitrosa]CAE6491617.1 conserved hypothetical protein [Nitrosomonas nitrosa]SFM40979.1 Protein of unknown function [Nitrosomonas nitrosa]